MHKQTLESLHLVADQRRIAGDELAQLSAFKDYANQFELLKPEDEIRLAVLVQAGLAEDADEEQIAHKEAASQEMFDKNLRLVISIAENYKKHHPIGEKNGILDLVQEGSTGLMHAITLFDPERGFRFSTYAYKWIQQRIQKFLKNHGTTIRVPIHVHEREKNVRFLEEEGKTDDQIQQLLDLDEDKILAARQASAALRKVYYLDEPLVTEYGEITLGEAIEDERGYREIQEVGSEAEDANECDDLKQHVSPDLYEALHRVFRESVVTAFEPVARGEEPNATQKRLIRSARQLLSHPAVRAELGSFGVGDADNSWGDDAACIGHVEVFAKGMAIEKTPNGEDKRVSTQKQAAEICVGCPVNTRAKCEEQLLAHRPAMGRWIDGKTSDMIRRAA